jgi:hypothetical protein
LYVALDTSGVTVYTPDVVTAVVGVTVAPVPPTTCIDVTVPLPFASILALNEAVSAFFKYVVPIPIFFNRPLLFVPNTVSVSLPLAIST